MRTSERRTVYVAGAVGTVEVDRAGNVYQNGRLLPQHTNKGGGYRYCRLELVDDLGQSFWRTTCVHVLVALGFHPRTAAEVDHINGIRQDNRATNLRWVSHRQNCNTRSARRNRKGLKRAPSVRHQAVLATARNGDQHWFTSVAQASAMTGAPRSCIYKCANRQYGFRTAAGYAWEWATAVA